MLLNLHTRISKHGRKLLAAAVLLGITGLAVASMGGEKKAKKTASKPTEHFVPIKTTTGFTLKAGPSYKGSLGFSTTKINQNQLSVNTLVTYQKGNTTYIMPYSSRITIGKTTACNSTQMLNLKLRMHK
ncbi:hypothetical protein [Flavihumibacter sp. CACIAM 22H1]|uniref:hypothetical protein n=1 Tax=Flavihumibacter sp. CACIAM 22H1 TaxID=1812911 RepID=UPI0007A8F39C|nr:hypothetical protein [Flavihumibacter sp. CACIAM 22H1]KYP16065.1 MAG: hypothetical protein A1D16_18520 [Flavihumibacter sp. CACIAM 22H1]